MDPPINPGRFTPPSVRIHALGPHRPIDALLLIGPDPIVDRPLRRLDLLPIKKNQPLPQQLLDRFPTLVASNALNINSGRNKPMDDTRPIPRPPLYGIRNELEPIAIHHPLLRPSRLGVEVYATLKIPPLAEVGGQAVNVDLVGFSASTNVGLDFSNLEFATAPFAS